MKTRQLQLLDWLNEKFASYQLTQLPGDASFRQYFRLFHDNETYIVMDAPPPVENCKPFIAIANALREKQLKVPDVIASDVERGFLLLSDLGNNLLLKTASPRNIHELYSKACDELAILQTCRDVPGYTIPSFHAAFMRNELALAKEWFLQIHLGLDLGAHENMLDEFFNFLAESAAAQPQVFMHRDFQTANLMVLHSNEIGILDFQDAFMGPITYDLVSLLKDCYIAWPEKIITSLALTYKQKVCENISDNTFIKYFDLMGLQRHIKALLTYARKFHRDKNANYLRHMPRTLNYILTTSARYKECRHFFIFLNNILLPTFDKVTYQCMQ